MVSLTSLTVVLDVFSFDAAEASCISREITRVPRAILLTMYDGRLTIYGRWTLTHSDSRGSTATTPMPISMIASCSRASCSSRARSSFLSFSHTSHSSAVHASRTSAYNQYKKTCFICIMSFFDFNCISSDFRYPASPLPGPPPHRVAVGVPHFEHGGLFPTMLRRLVEHVVHLHRFDGRVGRCTFRARRPHRLDLRLPM